MLYSVQNENHQSIFDMGGDLLLLPKNEAEKKGTPVHFRPDLTDLDSLLHLSEDYFFSCEAFRFFIWRKEKEDMWDEMQQWSLTDIRHLAKYLVTGEHYLNRDIGFRILFSNPIVIRQSMEGLSLRFDVEVTFQGLSRPVTLFDYLNWNRGLK